MRTLVPVSLLASMPLVACTLLVPFDTVSGSPCEAGACLDGALVRDVSAFDQGVDALEASALDASDADLDASDAESGACTGKADGASCGTNDACHDTPTCVAGVCTPHQKADGTPCAAALDACHGVPVCKTGVCGPSSPLAEGTQWRPGDDNARCCAGKPVETTSNTNCGVCGVVCNTGKSQSCGALNGHYFCKGCTLNTDCWSGCCSLTNAPHCSPSDCNTGTCHVPNLCPDMSHCQMDVVNYCSY